MRHIKELTIDDNNITIVVDGKIIQMALDILSPKLKFASDVERNFYKISPSGYGIHWPLIDEDLSIDALLKFALNK